jgi:hypothetical protein
VLHKRVFSSRRKNEWQVEQWTSIVIWKYWQGYIRLFVEDLKFGLMLRSCMTMLLLMTRSLSGSFWPKYLYWNWTIHHIRQIWPVELLTIPKTEDRFEGPTLPTFRDMWRPSWRAFQKRNSRNVLSSGNTDSLSVLVRKETTSKVTATISVYNIKYSFCGGIPGICHTSYTSNFQVTLHRWDAFWCLRICLRSGRIPYIYVISSIFIKITRDCRNSLVQRIQFSVHVV